MMDPVDRSLVIAALSSYESYLRTTARRLEIDVDSEVQITAEARESRLRTAKRHRDDADRAKRIGRELSGPQPEGGDG